MDNIFAPNWPRNPRGWIKFPLRDTDIRRNLFPSEAAKHPAKANLYMLQAIIDYLYKPGDILLDPMAGTGSIMLAALYKCRVLCIDCCEAYTELMEQCTLYLQNLSDIEIPHPLSITVLHGDCLDILPIPVDHICFSPPYSDIMKKLRVTEGDKSEYFLGMSEEEITRYSSGKGNLGIMPEFFHMQNMERVFIKCFQSLPSGGTMTLITKDHVEAGRRVYLTRKYSRAAERAGFKVLESYKWEAPGTGFIALYESKGRLVVKDEDITIFVKP